MVRMVFDQNPREKDLGAHSPLRYAVPVAMRGVQGSFYQSAPCRSRETNWIIVSQERTSIVISIEPFLSIFSCACQQAIHVLRGNLQTDVPLGICMAQASFNPSYLQHVSSSLLHRVHPCVRGSLSLTLMVDTHLRPKESRLPSFPMEPRSRTCS